MSMTFAIMSGATGSTDSQKFGYALALSFVAVPLIAIVGGTKLYSLFSKNPSVNPIRPPAKVGGRQRHRTQKRRV